MKKGKLNLSYNQYEVIVKDINGNQVQNLFKDPKLLKIARNVQLQIIINDIQYVVEMEKEIFVDFLLRGTIENGILKGEFLFFNNYSFSDVNYIEARTYIRTLNTIKNNPLITDYKVGHCYRVLDNSNNLSTGISLYLGKKYCITDRTDKEIAYGHAWMFVLFNEDKELQNRIPNYKCENNIRVYEEIKDKSIIDEINNIKNNLEIPCYDNEDDARSQASYYSNKYSDEKFSYYE